MESSRRGLLNDKAERRPILKNSHKYVPPQFWVHTQNRYGTAFLKTVFLVLLCSARPQKTLGYIYKKRIYFRGGRINNTF